MKIFVACEVISEIDEKYDIMTHFLSKISKASLNCPFHRVLGILAMIDSGETDWKVNNQIVVMEDNILKVVEVQQSSDHQVIAMDAEEAEQRRISDMDDLEREEPGMAKAVQDFFRLYKVICCVNYL